MQRIVINNDFGGFSLSRKATDRLDQLGHAGAKDELKSHEENPPIYCREYESFCREIKRNDPLLLQVVDEIGFEAASGSSCRIDIVEIPDGVEWEVLDGEGGWEWVAEKHRRWFGKKEEW